MFSRRGKGSVDETPRLAAEYRSQQLNGVWYVPSGGRARVAIGNSSTQKVAVTVIDSAGASQEIKLPPLGTRFVEIPPASQRGDEASAASLSIISQAAVGVVQAVGYVISPEGGTHTLRFYDPANMRSADLFATNLPIANRQVQLVLKNTGAQSLNARMIFRSATTGVPFTDLPPVQLAGGQAQVVDTSALMARAGADPDFHAVSAQIVSDGTNGSLVGALSAYDPATRVTFELPLRDRGTLKTSGGGYPIRLDGDYTTNVSITNVTGESAQFMGVIRYDGGEWIIPARSLQSGGTALFDIRRLRDDQAADPNGKTLPRDMTVAQFNWTMVSGGNTPRLIGRGHIASASRAVSASYSCWICCPDNGPFYDANPFWFQLVPGQSLSTTSRYSMSDCYGNRPWYNIVLTYADDSPQIAYTYNDSQHTWAHGASPGEAFHTWSWLFTEYNYIGGGECGSTDSNPSMDLQSDVDGFNVGDPMTISDGEQATFSMTVTGGTASSYGWSFSSPSNAGNNPHVNFTSSTSAQTNTDGHWFALPNSACSANLFSTYNIIGTVSFIDGQQFSKVTQLNVVLSPLAGFVNPNDAAITGNPALSQDQAGTWYVSGVGNLARQVPTSATIVVSSNSQFYNKTVQHEQVHLGQWVQGAGHLFGDLFLVSNFFAQIQNLTSSTSGDLTNQIEAARSSFEDRTTRDRQPAKKPGRTGSIQRVRCHRATICLSGQLREGPVRILYTTFFVVLMPILAAAQQGPARRVVSGEETEREVRRERELGNLYKRAAGSRFVLIGTVSKIKPVAERGHPPSIHEHIEGVLYTVSVEQTLCRQADFRPEGSHYESETVPASLQLFSPYRPYSEEKEILSLRQRYLLFLVIPDQAEQMQWAKHLTLDQQVTYYRGEENARGVISLPQPSAESLHPSPPEVLDKVTKLCDAVRPSDKAEKISRLQSLAHSGDPELEREARIGLEEITKSKPGQDH